MPVACARAAATDEPPLAIERRFGQTRRMADDVLHTHPLVEEIFAAHREHANGDDAGFEGYRGHAYRVRARRALARAGHGDEA